MPSSSESMRGRLSEAVVAVITIGVTAYATGLGGGRVPLTLVVLPVMIAFSFYVVLDLDRSRAGLISTGDLPMMRLQQQLNAGRP